MNTVQIQRRVYGFRDSEQLGPVNFVTVEDKLQFVAFDENKLVVEVMEIRVEDGNVSKARASLARHAKRRGHDLKGVRIEPKYCGRHYR